MPSLSVPENKLLLIFDEHCNLCSGFVSWLSRSDSHNKIQFISGQANEGKELLNKYNFSDFNSMVVVKQGEPFIRSQGMFVLLRQLDAPWKWFGIFRILPEFITDAAYRILARYRYFIFGKSDTCVNLKK